MRDVNLGRVHLDNAQLVRLTVRQGVHSSFGNVETRATIIDGEDVDCLARSRVRQGPAGAALGWYVSSCREAHRDGQRATRQGVHLLVVLTSGEFQPVTADALPT